MCKIVKLTTQLYRLYSLLGVWHSVHVLEIIHIYKHHSVSFWLFLYTHTSQITQQKFVSST